MDLPASCDVVLARHQLRGRAFLLGNKRAFSLTLPAAPGPSPASLHPHKWFGAYQYGHKFLEGQAVRVTGGGMLTGRRQIGLTAGFSGACRRYLVDEAVVEESYFVPDGVQAIASVIRGNLDLVVEPIFDMRFARALNENSAGYRIEPIDGGVLVSHPLPAGEYDDATERFLPAPDGAEAGRLWSAAQIVGDGAWAEMVPAGRCGRRALYGKDARRRRYLLSHDPADAADHAPLWDRQAAPVFAPVRFHLRGQGTILYGFGKSREEALAQLRELRNRLPALRAQKIERARAMLERAVFRTGDTAVDAAYVQVLGRLMDALVARQAVAGDTALDRPATMILAGNGYFHDSWKRDENIALGFLLALGYYDLARAVIADTWRLQDPVTGRLPQRIRAGEQPPYHSSDGTLWALWRLHGYWRCTGDTALLDEKLPMARLFFRRSIERTVEGMLPSGRTHHPDYLWETWMDTPHTPRDGFPIEIQILWIACLRAFQPLIAREDPELAARMIAAEGAAYLALQRFNVREIPVDSLKPDGTARPLITPNPYFCFGVDLDLGPEVEQAMRRHGHAHLAGKQGIITLSPPDWPQVFPGEFLADRRHVRGRRMRSAGKVNYHRGLEWNWLTQFFVRAELKYGEPERALRTYLRAQVEATLTRGGIGGLSELVDLSGARGPEFQTWSMSGFLEALHAFAGVEIDVPGRRIVVAPQLPETWPSLTVRKWYGNVPFDLRYRRDGEELTLSLDFPAGQTPDADIDIVLGLPPRCSAGNALVTSDGVPHTLPVREEAILGTPRSRVRCMLPASKRIDMTLTIRRARRGEARSA